VQRLQLLLLLLLASAFCCWRLLLVTLLKPFCCCLEALASFAHWGETAPSASVQECCVSK
jgi:hypothetical protein